MSCSRRTHTQFKCEAHKMSKILICLHYNNNGTESDRWDSCRNCRYVINVYSGK